MQAISCVFFLLFCCFVISSIASIPAHIPATHGKLRTNFLITAKGATKSGLYTYDITNNTGTFVVRGTKYIAVAYYTQGTQPWGSDQARWINFLGVAEDSQNVAWIVFQCWPIFNPTSIIAVYEEDYYHEGHADPTKAVCNFIDLAGKPDAIFDVHLPPVRAVPEPGRVDSNVTIIGKDVFLHRRGPGWINIHGKKYHTIPINNIPCPDCGSDCVGCMTSPWYETHVIFYSDGMDKIGFGIFYMYPYNRTIVQFNYSLILPTLEKLAITFDAHWYGDPMENEKDTNAKRTPINNKNTCEVNYFHKGHEKELGGEAEMVHVRRQELERHQQARKRKKDINILGNGLA